MAGHGCKNHKKVIYEFCKLNLLLKKQTRAVQRDRETCNFIQPRGAWWLKFGKCQATDLRVSDENMPLDQRKVSVQEKQCGRLHGIP